MSVTTVSSTSVSYPTAQPQVPSLMEGILQKRPLEELIPLMTAETVNLEINGRTPLSRAVDNCDIQLVDALIQHGAVVGFAMITAAICWAPDAIVDSLYSSDPTSLEKLSADGFTPLLTAVINGNLKGVKKLLALGANIQAIQGPAKFTCLHLAVGYGRANMIELFVGKDPSLLTINASDGTSPFKMALASGQIEALETLSRLGAANIQTTYGQNECSSLHIAVVHDQDRMIKHLVEKDPSLLTKNTSDRISPLMMAVIHGKSKAVCTLLDLGADFDVRFNQLTLLQIAGARASTAPTQQDLQSTQDSRVAIKQDYINIQRWLKHYMLAPALHQRIAQSLQIMSQDTFSSEDLLHLLTIREQVQPRYVKLYLAFQSRLFYDKIARSLEKIKGDISHSTDPLFLNKLAKQLHDIQEKIAKIAEERRSSPFIPEGSYISQRLPSLLSDIKNLITTALHKANNKDPITSFNNAEVATLVNIQNLSTKDDLYKMGLDSGKDLRAIGINNNLEILQDAFLKSQNPDLRVHILQEIRRKNAFLTQISATTLLDEGSSLLNAWEAGGVPDVASWEQRIQVFCFQTFIAQGVDAIFDARRGNTLHELNLEPHQYYAITDATAKRRRKTEPTVNS